MAQISPQAANYVQQLDPTWYKVGLIQHTCSCGRFQYNEVPCGHTIAVVRAAERGATRDFVPCDLTALSLRVAYAVPMAPVAL